MPDFLPDFLQIAIFPPGALQSSVVTTVWVGVCIVVFLNARFGTTLAGLVVPGYLVPLFFVKPVSAFVVLAEAYITYGLAWLLANKLLVRLGYSEMFGRDRFFALILLSVLVRIVLDFFALPFLIEQYSDYFSDYDLKNNLQSFGLIIVALIANQMWMGGIVKGSKSLFLYLGLTFAVIYWVLIPFTNFNIGGLNYMYEDLATSLLSSPKAYIILLTTAFIASRMNLQFGWEFNGILIPALLALQWYQPEKLVFTFLEALVILALGSAVMRIPFLRGTTFEGGRLLLLFFNVGFVYKILLGFALIEFLPTAKISDYYGFGYVVSALLAIKVYQKRIAVKMAVSTVFTSFVGIVLATFAGFFLTFTSTGTQNDAVNVTQQPVQLTSKALYPLFNELRSASFYNEIRPKNLSRDELARVRDMLQLLTNMTAHNKLDSLVELNQLNQGLQFDIWFTQQDVVVLHKTGIGFYAIRLASDSQNSGDLFVQVPAARAELGAASLGLAIFEKTQARALLIDLSYQLQSSGDYVFDSLLQDGYFQQFHQVFTQHNVLQVRGDLKITEQRKRLRQNQQESRNQLSIFRLAPQSLPMALLNNIVTDLDIKWQAHAKNPQWQHDSFGIAELHLNNREMRSALARIAVFQDTSSRSDISNLEGYLISWLLERKDSIARKGSEEFIIPTQNELLFWYQDILNPFMRWLKQHQRQGWDQQLRDELQRLNVLASSVGYQFKILQQPLTGNEFLILQEQDDLQDPDTPRKNWASLVVNLSAKSEYLVAVPNPFFEKTSFEFGSVLFRQLQNRFLLLSGTHPWANPDGSSNVTLTGNTNTLYHVLFMAIMREFEEQKVTPVQVRGFSFQESRPFPKEHALVSLWQNINQFQPSDNVQNLLSQLDDIGLTYRFVDGDVISAPYYLGTNQQIDYMDYVGLEDFVTLWISPLVRDSFKASEQIKIEEQHARLLGLPVYRNDLRSFALSPDIQQLNKDPLNKGPLNKENHANIDSQISTELLRQLQAYASGRNVHHLSNAILETRHSQLAYLLDSASLQQFLLVLDANQQVLAAINLNSLNQKHINATQPDALAEFVQSRFRWLIATPAKLPAVPSLPTLNTREE